MRGPDHRSPPRLANWYKNLERRLNVRQMDISPQPGDADRMYTYRLKLHMKDHLPDGRLSYVTWEPRPTRGWFVNLNYDASHLAEPLARDLAEYYRHLSRGVLQCDPSRIDETPDWSGHWERVPRRAMPLTTFRMLTGYDTHGQRFMVYRVREDMATEALCREVNELEIPVVSALLRFRVPMTVTRPVVYGTLAEYSGGLAA